MNNLFSENIVSNKDLLNFKTVFSNSKFVIVSLIIFAVLFQTIDGRNQETSSADGNCRGFHNTSITKDVMRVIVFIP